MARQLEPNQEKDALLIGRFLHENTYKRQRKEINLGHIKLDILRKETNRLVIGEVKKSSRFQKSAEMQLVYYLSELKQLGINAEGELLFPEEKSKKSVRLTPELETELDETIKKIEEIIQLNKPPEANQNHFCKQCAYQEFCWA